MHAWTNARTSQLPHTPTHPHTQNTVLGSTTTASLTFIDTNIICTTRYSSTCYRGFVRSLRGNLIVLTLEKTKEAITNEKLER